MRRPRASGKHIEPRCIGGPLHGQRLPIVEDGSTVHSISDAGWYLRRSRQYRQGHRTLTEIFLIWRPNPDAKKP